MLNSAACNCNFSRSLNGTSCINENISRIWNLRSHIEFKVTGANLDIAHIPGTTNNTATFIITNVAACDIGLMHVYIVIKNANAVVGINMAITDDNVSVTFG